MKKKFQQSCAKSGANASKFSEATLKQWLSLKQISSILLITFLNREVNAVLKKNKTTYWPNRSVWSIFFELMEIQIKYSWSLFPVQSTLDRLQTSPDPGYHHILWEAELSKPKSGRADNHRLYYFHNSAPFLCRDRKIFQLAAFSAEISLMLRGALRWWSDEVSHPPPPPAWSLPRPAMWPVK